MAKATFVEAAKKPIYKHGKRVEYVSQRGKRAGQTLSKIDRNQPQDENDEILINVGESYYTWCFYGGQPIYSKTQPRPSQLTQNAFKSELYSIQEKIEDFDHEGDPETIAVFVDEIKSDLESLRDTCQESLDNIPEQLQEAPAGQTLQERIENLDSAISEFEDIDTEFDSQLDEETDRDEDESDEDWQTRLDEEKTEWCDEKVGVINDIDLAFE